MCTEYLYASSFLILNVIAIDNHQMIKFIHF